MSATAATVLALGFGLVVAGAVFLGLAAAGTVGTVGVRRWKARPRVIVNTRSGETFAGVLVAARRQALQLAGVELLAGPGGSRLEAPARITGTVYVDRVNVTFVQAPEV